MKIDDKLEGAEKMTALMYALDKLKEQVGGVRKVELMFDKEHMTNLEEILQLHGGKSKRL